MAVGLTTEDSAAEIRQRQATLISPGYPPTIGGVETHVGRLADGLTNHGVHVSVYAGSPERSQVGVRDSDGVAVRIFRGFNVMSMTLSPRLLLHASRIRDRGALVHVHSYHSLSGFAVTLVGRGPVVFTPHYHGDGHTPLAAALHRAYHLVGRRLFRRADAIVCVSESERELLESDYSFVRGKTFVVPNAIDTESIQSASPFPQDDRVVLSVGRLESYKNVDVLLRAFAAVDDSASLVVVGTGPELPKLKSLAEEAGIAERVRFLGRVEQDTLNSWLRTAHVVVSLSDHEAFGIVALEGATAGAHVLLSDIPAHWEVASRYVPAHSTIVDTENPEHVATSLSELLRRPKAGAATSVPDAAATAASIMEVYDFARNRADMRLAASPHTRGPGIVRPRVQRRRSRFSRPRTHRIGSIDRAWRDHSAILLAGPLDVPNIDDVRRNFLQFLAENPRNPMSCRINSAGTHWLSVPKEDRWAHACSVITSRDADTSPADHHSRLQAIIDEPLPSSLPFQLTFWGDWVYLQSNHAFGDGTSLSAVALALTLNRPEMFDKLTTRLTLSTVVRAMMPFAPRNTGEWLTYGSGLLRRHLEWSSRKSTPDPSVARNVEAPRPSRVVIGTTIDKGAYQSLNGLLTGKWSGVSLAALLAAALYRALVAEGVQVSPNGLQMLFDMRRYLPASGNLSVGNGAKSLFIESDVTDPASISHEMKKSQNVKRALPSTVLGAAMSLLPKSSASIYETAQSPSERLLTMSIMPRLPHMEHSASIPWHDDHRVTGIGLSDAVGSISVFAVYGDQTIDLVTAVAETDPDRAAVRRAFDRLTNPSSVLRTDPA